MKVLKFSDEELTNLAKTIQMHIEYIDGQMGDRRTQWQIYIDQFKAKRKVEEKTFPWPHCSNIFIPDLANHITTISSFMLASRMKSTPVMRVHNYFKEDAAMVGELENFIDFYMMVVQKQRQYWRRYLPYTILLGTHISKQVYMSDEITGWPYAKPVGVSLFQFYTYPAILDLRASPFVADVSYVPTHEILAWMQKDKSVVKQNVEKTIALIGQTIPQIDAWKQKYGTQYDDLPPGYTPVFNCYMLYSRDPIKELPVKIHVRYDLFTQNVLSLETYSDYEMPYIPVYWRRDPDSFYGIGVGQMAWTIQDGINTAYNQTIDNVTIANIRMVSAEPNSGVDPEEGVYPGKVVITSGVVKPLALGDVYPSVWVHINILKQALEATTAVPQSFMGMADSILKSGNAPGLAASSINQSSMRLDFFTGEFDEGLTDLIWHSLAMLAKYSKGQNYELPSQSTKQMLIEWLNQGGAEAEATGVEDMLAARVEPESVEDVASKVFNLEKVALSKSRFSIQPFAKEVNAQAEQQASMMLSQLVNAYVNRITQFATQLAQLQQSGGTATLQKALLDAWHAVNFTMRRVLTAFAVEDAGEIVSKLEEVTRGLGEGIGELGKVAAGATGSTTQGPAEPIDVGTGFAGGAGEASGILGGAPTLAVRAGRGVEPEREAQTD